MEDIDIKNFTRVSSVTDEDSVLLSRGVSSATHGQIAVGLFRSSISKGITPAIVDGMWYVGSSNTGVPAKGEDGKTPVLKTGTVTTGLPDTQVVAQVKYDGVDESGSPVYLIDLTIPAGKPGQDGDGAGNVYVTTDTLQSGKLYLFQPGADGSANGTMVEFDNQGGVGQQYPGYPGAEIFNDYTNNVAAGKNAHAEGQETNATGPRAHAEGYKTTVYAADAHAEGRNTWAMGNYSHAEGLYGIAFGSSSHVEGNVETDTGVGEDSAVILNDEELIRNFLSEFTTKYLGKAVYRKLDWDKIGNYKFHCALGISSHAEGINNIVCDKAGHVEGYNNVCGDEIPGKEEDAVSYAPHAEGMNNRMASRVLASHVGGAYCTVNSGHYSFAHGYCLSVSNDYETAFGRYNLSQYNGKKVLFAYGIGSSDSGRENAFAILEDGTVVIPKMEGGNVSDIVAKLLVPVYDEINRLANKYSSLSETVKSQQAQIDSLVNLIGQYHPVGEKAYVVQEMLFFTDKIDASVQGDTLSLSDEATTVENGVLTIK